MLNSSSAAPTSCQLPCQVVGILNAGVHAEAAGGRKLMGRISSQKHPASLQTLCLHQPLPADQQMNTAIWRRRPSPGIQAIFRVHHCSTFIVILVYSNSQSSRWDAHAHLKAVCDQGTHDPGANGADLNVYIRGGRANG